MVQTYTCGIYIDNVFFDVPLVSIKRTADFLDKYANRTEDGVLHRELIGVYYNYQVSFGTMKPDVHELLFDKLSEPVPYHFIKLPKHTTGGSKTGLTSYASFDGYISGLSDEIKKIRGAEVQYYKLTCKMTAMVPTLTPPDPDI